MQKVTTGKTVTPEYLERLMSGKNKKAYLSYEIYYTSGALFCFIRDRLGNNAFANFYRLITGDSCVVSARGEIATQQIKRIDRKPPRRSFTTTASLRDSLRVAIMLEGYDEKAEGKTTDEVINAYIKEFCDMINIPDIKPE